MPIFRFFLSFFERLSALGCFTNRVTGLFQIFSGHLFFYIFFTMTLPKQKVVFLLSIIDYNLYSKQGMEPYMLWRFSSDSFLSLQLIALIFSPIENLKPPDWISCRDPYIFVSRFFLWLPSHSALYLLVPYWRQLMSFLSFWILSQWFA